MPITIESVYDKISSTQEFCRKNSLYVPTIDDYLLLMRLCIADAKAQSKVVIQDGVLIDSLEQKLARLNAIISHIEIIRSANTELCDFHTHSVFSDGTDTPRELVSKAANSGIRAIALTDHNTIDGLDEFERAALKYEIDTIPGIEFSTEHENHELHIVALFVKKSAYMKINKFLSKAKEAKVESNRLLIQNLKNDGYPVSYEELKIYSFNNNINRAVIGQYLEHKGIIPSVKEGFKTILSKESGYYIPPKRSSTLDTIKFIKSIGAVAILAHPLLDLSLEELQCFIPVAKEAGLDGMETYYSSFSKEESDRPCKLAYENALLESVGNDYHRSGKSHICLGNGTGNLAVPISIYLQILRKFQH